MVFGGGNTATVASSTNVTLANNFTAASAFGNFTASGGTMTINGNFTGGQQWNVTPTNKITFAGTNTLVGVQRPRPEYHPPEPAAWTSPERRRSAAPATEQVLATFLIAGAAVSVKTGGTLNINGTTNATKASVIVSNSAATGTLRLTAAR